MRIQIVCKAGIIHMCMKTVLYHNLLDEVYQFVVLEKYRKRRTFAGY